MMGQSWLVVDTSRYQVKNGEGFHLSQFNPAEGGKWDKESDVVGKLLKKSVKKIAFLQDLLFSNQSWSLLVVFQAMDTGGKDSAIKHVFSGVNPQGVRVNAFKQPSSQQLAHDYLWRPHLDIPPAGMIGVYNRSYYEEVIVTKVHPELLEKQNLPPEVRTGNFWHDRYQDIRHWEQYLTRQGVIVLKFFLHISVEEQRRRLLRRLNSEKKLWKFSLSDIRERQFWGQYQDSYCDAITNTSTPQAPWYIVPGNHKNYTRFVITQIIIEVLKSLKLTFPTPEASFLQECHRIRDELSALD